jgi:hypothetical protein
MNIDTFMNSKRLFRTVRYEAQYAAHVPAMVHVRPEVIRPLLSPSCWRTSCPRRSRSGALKRSGRRPLKPSGP